MHTRIGRRMAAGILAAAGLGIGGAAAHHGWSWAEGEQTELRGTVREVYVGQPHPSLRVEAADGLWTVELANPARPSAPASPRSPRSRATRCWPSATAPAPRGSDG